MRNALTAPALHSLRSSAAIVVPVRRSHTRKSAPPATSRDTAPLTSFVGCSATCVPSSSTLLPPQHTCVPLSPPKTAWLPQTGTKSSTECAHQSPTSCTISPDEVHAVVTRALERNEWQRAVALFRGALRLACVPRAATYPALLRGVLYNAGVVSACKLIDVLATSPSHRGQLYEQLVLCAVEPAEAAALASSVTWLLHSAQSRGVALPMRVYHDVAVGLLRRGDVAATLAALDYGLREFCSQSSSEKDEVATTCVFTEDVIRLVDGCLRRMPRHRVPYEEEEVTKRYSGEVYATPTLTATRSANDVALHDVAQYRGVPVSPSQPDSAQPLLATILSLLQRALCAMRLSGSSLCDHPPLLRCLRRLSDWQDALCARHLAAWAALLHEVRCIVTAQLHHGMEGDNNSGSAVPSHEEFVSLVQSVLEQTLRHVYSHDAAALLSLGGRDILLLCEDAAAVMACSQTQESRWLLLGEVLPLCCGVLRGEEMEKAPAMSRSVVLESRCGALSRAVCAGLSHAGMYRETLRCMTQCDTILQWASMRLAVNEKDTDMTCEDARALLQLSLGALRQPVTVQEKDGLHDVPCVTGNELPWWLMQWLQRRRGTVSDTTCTAVVQNATRWVHRMTGLPHFRLSDALMVINGLLSMAPSHGVQSEAMTALCDACIMGVACSSSVTRAEYDACESTLQRISQTLDKTVTVRKQAARKRGTCRALNGDDDRKTLRVLAGLLLYAAPQEQLQLVRHYCGDRLSLWQVATWLVQQDEESTSSTQLDMPSHTQREDVVAMMARQYLLHTRLVMREGEVGADADAWPAPGRFLRESDTHMCPNTDVECITCVSMPSQRTRRSICSSRHAMPSAPASPAVSDDVFHGLLDAAMAAEVMARAKESPAVRVLRKCHRWSVVAEAELRQGVYAQRRGRPAIRLAATAPTLSRRHVAQYWHVHHARLAPELTLRLPELLCLAHYVPRLRAMAAQYGSLSHTPCKTALAELAAEVQLRHFALTSSHVDSLWCRPRTARAIELLFHRLYDTLLRLDAQPALAQTGRAEFMRCYSEASQTPSHSLVCRVNLIAHALRLRRRAAGPMRLPWSMLSAVVQACTKDETEAETHASQGSDICRRVMEALRAADVPEWQCRLVAAAIAAVRCGPHNFTSLCEGAKSAVGETPQRTRQREDTAGTSARLIATIRSPALKALMQATHALLQGGEFVPAMASLALLECYQRAVTSGSTEHPYYHSRTTGADVSCEDLLRVWQVMTRGRWLSRLEQPAHGAAMRRLVCPS